MAEVSDQYWQQSMSPRVTSLAAKEGCGGATEGLEDRIRRVGIVFETCVLFINHFKTMAILGGLFTF